MKAEDIEEEIPGLLTARQAVSRYHLTYRGLWAAEAMGLLRPLMNGTSGLTFREYMAKQDFDRPDPSWASEDVVAWFVDERVGTE